MNASRRVATACVGAAFASAVATTAIGLMPPEGLAPVPVFERLAEAGIEGDPFAGDPLAGPDPGSIGDPWWDAVDGGQPRGQRQAAGDGPEAAEQDFFFESVRGRGMTFLRRELSLVRQICPALEDRQKALLLEAGHGAIDRAVDELVEQADRRGPRRRPRREQLPNLDTAIHDALANALKDHVGDDAAAAYDAERGLRQARRKAAVVAAIVADVDTHAFLDDAERDAVAAALARAYRDRWQTEVAGAHGQGMALTVMQGVERCVEKALGKERKDQWLAARAAAGREAAADQQQQQGMQVRQVQQGIQVQVLGGGGVRRVIRQQVQMNGDRVELRVELRVGDAAAAGEAADDPFAGAEGEPEPENGPVEDRK